MSPVITYLVTVNNCIDTGHITSLSRYAFLQPQLTKTGIKTNLVFSLLASETQIPIKARQVHKNEKNKKQKQMIGPHPCTLSK